MREKLAALTAFCLAGCATTAAVVAAGSEQLNPTFRAARAAAASLCADDGGFARLDEDFVAAGRLYASIALDDGKPLPRDLYELSDRMLNGGLRTTAGMPYLPEGVRALEEVYRPRSTPGAAERVIPPSGAPGFYRLEAAMIDSDACSLARAERVRIGRNESSPTCLAASFAATPGQYQFPDYIAVAVRYPHTDGLVTVSEVALIERQSWRVIGRRVNYVTSAKDGAPGAVTSCPAFDHKSHPEREYYASIFTLMARTDPDADKLPAWR
ncbi:MAG: hypothetical protein AAGH41_05645 [Pseudomonadota bacterium]